MAKVIARILLATEPEEGKMSESPDVQKFIDDHRFRTDPDEHFPGEVLDPNRPVKLDDSRSAEQMRVEDLLEN